MSNPRLFHGTGHIFKPGEMIEGGAPGSISSAQNLDPSWKTSKNVYLTSSLDEARDYANQRGDSRFSPVYETPNDTAHSAYDMLEGEPILGRGGYRGKYKNTYVSQQPVKPGKIVAWGENKQHTKLSPQFSSVLMAHSSMLGAGTPDLLK
jgi:hypothetical protein